MDCLSPIRIVNPSKFVSLYHRDNYILWVPCGRCAACQERLRNEWFFRAFYEFQGCVKSNRYSYVLFDCLTYRPKDVPRVSNFVDNLPKSLDFMCFDYRQLRLFLVRLRRYLRKYNPEKTLRYFAATEYGVESKYTHRPHIHILFYVDNPNLDSFTLSRAISHCWQYGRTDGLPFKSRAYVSHNTLRDIGSSSSFVCKYISKYVVKDSSFQKVIDNRLERVSRFLWKSRYKDDYHSFEDWQNSIVGKDEIKRLRSHINQFHRQSLGFGISLLSDIDILELIETNIISIPDSDKIVSRLSLPLYYKRKIFYDLIDVDGTKIWTPNELGLKYLEKRKLDLINRLIDEYKLAKIGLSDEEIKNLVDYVVNYRGRINANEPQILDIVKKLEMSDLVFSYTTRCDKKQFGKAFVSPNYCGVKDNYYYNDFKSISITEFIAKYVYFSPFFEDLLFKIDKAKEKSKQSYQNVFELKQDLERVYKSLQVSL